MIDAATMEAEVIGEGPVPLQDALELAARAELYACIRDTKWGVINFGRNRRLATPLQQLALTVRDRGCVYPKCDAHWTRTEAHHIIDFQDGGLTNLEQLAPQCRTHHPHLHQNGLELYRNQNGEWDVRPRNTGPPPNPG